MQLQVKFGIQSCIIYSYVSGNVRAMPGHVISVILLPDYWDNPGSRIFWGVFAYRNICVWMNESLWISPRKSQIVIHVPAQFFPVPGGYKALAPAQCSVCRELYIASASTEQRKNLTAKIQYAIFAPPLEHCPPLAVRRNQKPKDVLHFAT